MSAQQKRIVEGILHAMPDKQIAAQMGLKIPTVRTYLEGICTRLGVNGRMELVLHILAISERTRCDDCANQRCHRQQ